MEGLFFIGLVVVLGYPFVASMMASAGLRRRVALLEDGLKQAMSELHTLRAALHTARDSAPPQAQAAPSPVQPRAPAAPPPVPEPPPAQAAAPAPTPSSFELPTPAAPSAAAPAPPRAIRPPAPEPMPPRSAAQQPLPEPALPPREVPAWLRAAKAWLFTGNLVAKLGLLILFIGVSFLLKYASERVTVPIELRLAGIVLADIALLVWGWRMRATHRGLSLPIQGAALGILMLVTFGAFRIYGLIPSGLAFALLFVLTAFTCVLAVMQNALWLAVFGIAGGFVSPILTSTGQGSHIALFSYYALLNAGVLAIAWKRTWRALNLLGFAFTFVIGTTWGVLRYAPDQHYLSTQLFLALFFAYYVAIAVVYGIRQSVAIKAYVDATLVFGTPLAAFGLQMALVKHVAFGNAYSALAMGAFYALLALALWRRRGSGLRMLVESFLALGVVFGTLAIPFALDGRWTSAAWALEGAGVVWAALRQRHRLAFWFGMLVQAGAWISFIAALSGISTTAARDANLWLGFLILAMTAFFMAVTLRRHKDGEAQAFPAVASAFLGFAALWLLAGAWTEILLRQRGTDMANLLVASALAVTGILGLIAIRMQWPRARVFSLAAQSAAGLALLTYAVAEWEWTQVPDSLFSEPLLGAMLICAAAIFSSYSMWRRPLDMGMDVASRMLLAWAAFWLFGPILQVLSGYLAQLLPGALATTAPAQGRAGLYFIGITAAALAVAAAARRLEWARLRWLAAPAWVALPLALFMLMVILYEGETMPEALPWTAFAFTWAGAEYLLQKWPANGWPLHERALKALHFIRTAGPWIMLWKAGEIAISGWLYGAGEQRALLSEGGYSVSGSWANFVPAWLMMAFVVWLIGRARAGAWPTAPIAAWYRRVLIPAAAIWSLLLAGWWNMFQDGSMAPLPYVPLLNPLDLTTAFALALAAFAWRMLQPETGTMVADARRMMRKLPLAGAAVAYVWFNLILLRTAAHGLDIDYAFAPLFASLFVQAMMSLVWSITALVLMRWATRRSSRNWWMAGAALLAVVVAKLFLVDLSGTGSVARIVSFVGVGLLMVLIGYLAPYPSAAPVKEEGV